MSKADAHALENAEPRIVQDSKQVLQDLEFVEKAKKQMLANLSCPEYEAMQLLELIKKIEYQQKLELESLEFELQRKFNVIAAEFSEEKVWQRFFSLIENEFYNLPETPMLILVRHLLQIEALSQLRPSAYKQALATRMQTIPQTLFEEEQELVAHIAHDRKKLRNHPEDSDLKKSIERQEAILPQRIQVRKIITAELVMRNAELAKKEKSSGTSSAGSNIKNQFYLCLGKLCLSVSEYIPALAPLAQEYLKKGHEVEAKKARMSEEKTKTAAMLGLTRNSMFAKLQPQAATAAARGFSQATDLNNPVDLPVNKIMTKQELQLLGNDLLAAVKAPLNMKSLFAFIEKLRGLTLKGKEDTEKKYAATDDENLHLVLSSILHEMTTTQKSTLHERVMNSPMPRFHNIFARLGWCEVEELLGDQSNRLHAHAAGYYSRWLTHFVAAVNSALVSADFEPVIGRATQEQFTINNLDAYERLVLDDGFNVTLAFMQKEKQRDQQSRQSSPRAIPLTPPPSEVDIFRSMRAG
jgi:hypothetical protein